MWHLKGENSINILVVHQKIVLKRGIIYMNYGLEKQIRMMMMMLLNLVILSLVI